MNDSKKLDDLQHLSDDELVAAVSRLVRQRCGLTAELLAHIAEMDARKVYREHACSSMFSYVTERLHLSEAAAYKHIQVGRLARRFPPIFDLLEAGDTHLSSLVLLAPHLTEDNHRELLAAVRHKSKRATERLVAERFPKAPVPERIRKLPAPRTQAKTGPAVPRGKSTSPAPPAETLTLTAPTPKSSKPGRVEPLAPDRFRVEFTADGELYDNIDKAKALLGPRLPRGELSELFALAMRRLVEDLEKKKFAKTSRPRRAPEKASATSESASGSRRIPNHVKRAVAARDGAQCTFVDENSNRCTERWGLEFHHDGVPFARGGPPTVENLTLLCKNHNQLMAERDFGAEFIAARKIAAKATKRAVSAGDSRRAGPS